jgi:hypothetical protein
MAPRINIPPVTRILLVVLFLQSILRASLVVPGVRKVPSGCVIDTKPALLPGPGVYVYPDEERELDVSAHG